MNIKNTFRKWRKTHLITKSKITKLAQGDNNFVVELSKGKKIFSVSVFKKISKNMFDLLTFKNFRKRTDASKHFKKVVMSFKKKEVNHA